MCGVTNVGHFKHVDCRIKCYQCQFDVFLFLVNDASDSNSSVILRLVYNLNTTLSAECPTDVTITYEDEPFRRGDVLTCSADGYDPTYTWTGVINGVTIDTYTGSLYTLPVGDFELICTASVDELVCTGDLSDELESSAFGKY